MTPAERARKEHAERREVVKAISENPVLHNRLYLCRNGVPFDVAFSLDSVDAEGWSLQFARMDGHQWDWATDTWKKRPGE